MEVESIQTQCKLLGGDAVHHTSTSDTSETSSNQPELAGKTPTDQSDDVKESGSGSESEEAAALQRRIDVLTEQVCVCVCVCMLGMCV